MGFVPGSFSGTAHRSSRDHLVGLRAFTEKSELNVAARVFVRSGVERSAASDVASSCASPIPGGRTSAQPGQPPVLHRTGEVQRAGGNVRSPRILGSVEPVVVVYATAALASNRGPHLPAEQRMRQTTTSWTDSPAAQPPGSTHAAPSGP